jgi:hypothetical protein
MSAELKEAAGNLTRQDFNSALSIRHSALKAVVSEARAILAKSSHPWAKALDWVLRTRLIRTARLPWKMAGFTFAILPVIWLDREFVARGMAAGDAGRARVIQTLLHEAAHQLGAVWPEWRNWLGDRSHYGPERNAADAIAENIMRESGLGSAYADRRISYVSPLQRIGILRRS